MTFGFSYVVLISLVDGAGIDKVVAQAVSIVAATPSLHGAEALELPGLEAPAGADPLLCDRPMGPCQPATLAIG